jgi:putative flippase GtrA
VNTPPLSTSGLLARLSAQAGRFASVGVLNTLVDFVLFNALWAWLEPRTPAGLALVAAAAAGVATLNSYLLNAHWTFRQSGHGRGVAARFVGFALLGIAVQTGTALFVSHKLLSGMQASPVVIANAAKLCAVLAAFLVTFAGYRIAVFTPASLLRFRESFSLLPDGRLPSAAPFAGILLLALAVRIGFILLAPVAYGDAVSYSWVAWAIGHGHPEQADVFWHSLFDYWQAILVWLGLQQYPALVIASLLPGMAVVLPAMLLASRLYGKSAAVIAGLAVALHPRLVEYSVNGYAEMFFLNAALWGVWGVTTLIGEPKRRAAALASGAGLAAWVLVRNEALPVALLLMMVPPVLSRSLGWRSWLPSVTLALVAATVITGLTFAADAQFFGKPQFLAKAANASRLHVEMLDPVAAASETYGMAKSSQPAVTGPGPNRLQVMLERWPRNIAYSLERLPGVLLSPIFLAALLLPALVRRRAAGRREWPLLLFSLWPLLFYPLLQLEPRMLFPVVIGACIFGAAGLVALGRFLDDRVQWTVLRHAPAAATLVLLVPLVVLLALRSEAERGAHRQVGAWIAANVPRDVALYGDGYGYVAASSFWAGRQAKPRPWTESGEALAAWAESQGPAVVIVYDGFLREFNPGLAGTGGMGSLTRLATLPMHGADTARVWADAAAIAQITRPSPPLAATGWAAPPSRE